VLRVIGSERALFFEGCLSVDGYAALVGRATEVEVSGLDHEGTAQSWRVRGWPARILQHEIDHLDGTLYIDRMLSRSFTTRDQLLSRYWTLDGDQLRRMFAQSANPTAVP
jgi:peptide deformylase